MAQRPPAMGARDDDALRAVLEAAGDPRRALLTAIEERLLALARSHGPELAAHAEATIAAGGKRLRPLCVLLAGWQRVEEPEIAAGLVRAGVAVELIHAATLVHDDVLDAAALRRGRPTVVAAAGRAMAVAVGDLLFSHAFAELTAGGAVDQVRVLASAARGLAEGELMQRSDAWDAGISVERYLLRCECKTARLFEAACALGALQTGVAAGPLGDFGRRIGLAFQVLDDVLDVEGPAERIGKHRGTDLLDGTVTLPLLLAREQDPGLAAVDLRAISDPAVAEALCDRIAATGALVRSRELALAEVAAAKENLPGELAAGQQQALELIADAVVRRYR